MMKRNDKWALLHSWTDLEKTHNLKLHFANGEGHALGTYQGYQFKLETFTEIEGGIFSQKLQPHNIRLILFGDKFSNNLSLTSPLSENICLTEQSLTELFSISNPQSKHFLHGTTCFYKKTLTYVQKNVEPQVTFLQLLFDKLCNLLDAYPYIVSLEGEVVAPLKDVVTYKQHPFKAIAVHLLKDIATIKRTQLGRRLSDFLCPNCLTHIISHTITLADEEIIYYGCRMCTQSHDFLEVSYVVAILDNQSKEEIRQKGKVTYVNWLLRRRLFDFNMIEIIHATDEDVERFLVQIGNDTDPMRIERYKQMHYLIKPDCHLSANTLRILEQMFGKKE